VKDLDGVAILLCLATALFAGLTRAFGLLPIEFRTLSILFGVLTETLGW
jgi:hypothetical protein